jgi:hypothetical protein
MESIVAGYAVTRWKIASAFALGTSIITAIGWIVSLIVGKIIALLFSLFCWTTGRLLQAITRTLVDLHLRDRFIDTQLPKTISNTAMIPVTESAKQHRRTAITAANLAPEWT